MNCEIVSIDDFHHVSDKCCGLPGAMLSPKELEELCELTDAHGIQFLSDEIYHGISYGTKAATALQYSNNVVVINSFSKYYSSKYASVILGFFSLSILHNDFASSNF